ncbi:MAG: glycoside hydrolase family protein [Opitutaceae bacterium]|jgi:hypothetical protein|nr:glycoside hydrolase family protein [Opitutaceae bacterium]
MYPLFHASLAFLIPAVSLFAGAFEPVDITTLFPEANSTVSIVFSAPPQSEQGRSHTWRLTDYDGVLAKEGQAVVNAAGNLEVALTLPAGYYEVRFDGNSQSTGLWCHPGNSVRKDNFMAVDTAISWLTKPEQREALIRNLPKFVGMGGMARERLSWPQINPAHDRWDWETNRKFESTRRLYQKNRVPVLEVFHYAPKWVGYAQGGLFPDDLVASDKAWREITLRWQQTWGALEVWNEPEIRFGGDQPADQYIPLVKTIRHALHAVGAQIPVGGGVFSAMNPGYLDLAARNGLLDECDFVSFHYYGDPLGLQGLVAQYRDWLARFGRESKPLWMTEAGLAYPPDAGGRPTKKVQADVSLTYAMQLVEARACGIERFFPFVYADYSERSGTRNYGMQDRTGSPLRMLAASGYAGQMLDGMDYLGDVSLNKIPGAKRIRVFAPAGEDASGPAGIVLMVIYTGSVSPHAEVTLPFEVQSAAGIDGRPLSVAEGGRKVSISDGLVWLRVSRKALEGILDKDTDAMRLFRIGKKTLPSLPPPSSIVIQPQIAPKDLGAISASGYFLPPDRSHLSVSVVVNNLGDSSRTVSVQAAGAPDVAVTLGARSRKVVPLKIDLSALPIQKAANNLTLSIKATSNDGERIAPAEMALIPASGLSEHLRGSSYQFSLVVNEAYRWNQSANGAITSGLQPSGTWGFTVKFKPGADRWAYPSYAVPQEVDQEKVSGVLVRARCLKLATVRLLTWDGHGNMSQTRFAILPADGQWHVAYVPLASLTRTGYHGTEDHIADVTKLARISVGFNSGADENTLEISDLYLIEK